MDHIDSSMEEYLAETEVLDYNDERVKRFTEQAVGDEHDPKEQAVKLFYAVRDKILYEMRVPFHRLENYRASRTLERGHGYCVQKAAVLIAGARACGIPARFGFADLRNHGVSKDVVEMMGCNVLTYHCFAELFLGGRWIKATPSFDPSVCKKHSIAPLSFDGEHDAVFPPKDLKGRPYAEYLRYHPSYADVPLEAIIAGWKGMYGEDRVNTWMADLDAAGLT